MSESLPGYDAYKLATPPYLEPNPPCGDCAHEDVEHMVEPHPFSKDTHPCRYCLCRDYRPRDAQDEADDAYDAATERAERRREW